MVCLFTVILSFKSWQETCLITHLLLVFCTIAQMAKYLSHLACVSCSYTFKLHIFCYWSSLLTNTSDKLWNIYCSLFRGTCLHVQLSYRTYWIDNIPKDNKLDWAFLYQVIGFNKMKCDSCGFQWPTPSQMDCGKYKNVSSNIINIKSLNLQTKNNW